MADEARRLTLRTWGTPLAVEVPAELVSWYLGAAGTVNVKYGPTYYQTTSTTPEDIVSLEDLGFAVLFVGRPSSLAARSLATTRVDIGTVPHKPLHMLDDDGRKAVVDAVMDIVGLDGFGSALATKVLHKKRPATVPVLDNKAIFGTYLDDTWIPGQSTWPKRSVTVRGQTQIADAVNKVARDLAHSPNAGAWTQLEREFSQFTRVELFDMVWWATARGANTDIQGRAASPR